MPGRALSTSAVHRIAENELTTAQKNQYYPKIGNRAIVGFGINGDPSYIDRTDFPFPAVRFREDNAEIAALRKKEEGDWKSLSLEEKKTLYRASFCQTYAEMEASTGEWKAIVAGVIFGLGFTCWIMAWMKTKVYPPIPHTITEEWKKDSVELMVRQRQGHVEGVSSLWDYEKNEWKS